MKPVPALILAAALGGTAAAYPSAARAIVTEYSLMTESVSRVKSDVYRAGYRNEWLVTRGCWVMAYAEPALITRTQIIFIDIDTVCWIAERRQPDED